MGSGYSLSIKYVVLTILIFSMIPTSHFLAWIIYPEEDSIFNAYDEGQVILYTDMKSYLWNFESPWILETEPLPSSIFSNPANGPTYLFVLLGLVYVIVGIPFIAFYVFFVLSSAVLLLVATY